jgi:hypothetical protein
MTLHSFRNGITRNLSLYHVDFLIRFLLGASYRVCAIRMTLSVRWAPNSAGLVAVLGDDSRDPQAELALD